MEREIKRAIVTGGTGVIGVALIEELAEQGVEVLVLHNETSGRLENIPKHPLVHLQPCSLAHLDGIEPIEGKKYDVFFHLAWGGTFGDRRDDMYLQQQNITFSLDAVGAAKRFGCRLFIGLGSQAEYGIATEKLTAETPVHPTSGYGIAKLCAGQMTRKYAKQLGLQHIWVRVLSVYGRFDGSQTMIMSTIDKLSHGKTPELTAGEQIWDYLNERDAAKALLLLARKGNSGKTYVLGSGEGKPLRTYIEEMRDMIAPGAELDFGAIPYSENQVMYLCADIGELQKDTGWKPQVTFGEGVRKIVEQVTGQ